MLATLLPGEVFSVLLIFVRVGATVMLMPGVGDPYVAMRIRLLLSLFIALLMTPVLAPTLPALPDAPAAMVLLIVGEAVVGIFLGSLARILMGALTTAGMIIAMSSAMANALVNDPTAAQQGSVVGSFLTVVALMVIFSLNLHYLLLMALVDSYALFVPGQALPVGDFTQVIIEVVARSFLLAFQLAAPFAAVALIFYLGVGLLSRLMPQVQIFFVAMPLQIALAFIVLFFSLPVMMRWFATSFEDTIMPFVGRL